MQDFWSLKSQGQGIEHSPLQGTGLLAAGTQHEKTANVHLVLVF